MTRDCIIKKPYGTYRCYSDHVVGIPAEGAVIKQRQVKELQEEFERIYDDHFVYIADRIRPSSFELSVYPFINRVNHGLLRGIGVVAHRPITHLVAETEAALADKLHFAVFDTLEEAELWVPEVLSMDLP